jgi:hypothetical protein
MRSIIVLLVVLSLSVVLLVSCPREVGNKAAVVTGRVTDTDTTIYLTGVKVFERSHALLNTETDAEGYFRMEGVSFEEHNIYFEKDGYEPYTLWFEYTGDLERPVISHKIIMKKIGAPAAPDSSR